MNREIKFRAWVENSAVSEMVYPEIIDMGSPIANGLWYKVGFINQYPNKRILEDWQKNIVFMQFTGLHDKNGKEIYEGDILQRDAEWAGEKIGEEFATVFFKRGQFMILWHKDKKETSLANLLNGFFIIGNIYENPDLCNT